MPTLLSVKGLVTQFMTREGIVRAVDNVSFDVEQGETMGLVGESGCGKSVTALSLMRLVQHPGDVVSGEVHFEGSDILRLREAEVRRIRGNRIAMIFQDPMTSLNPVLTIGRQITEALELHLSLSSATAKRRAAELLDMVGIPGGGARLEAYPHQFSGGMRQRVMIAIALSCNPSLLLADEPTTALDVTIQAQILDLLKTLADQSQTAIVLITHDLGVVAGMTQRVRVMYAGQIVEATDTDELFANPRMPYTWGLLRSLPRHDQVRQSKLRPIHGSPPDLLDPPRGCRFASRCEFKRDICETKQPDLLPAGASSPNHLVRCWGTQPGGWLVHGRPTGTGAADDEA